MEEFPAKRQAGHGEGHLLAVLARLISAGVKMLSQGTLRASLSSWSPWHITGQWKIALIGLTAIRSILKNHKWWFGGRRAWHCNNTALCTEYSDFFPPFICLKYLQKSKPRNICILPKALLLVFRSLSDETVSWQTPVLPKVLAWAKPIRLSCGTELKGAQDSAAHHSCLSSDLKGTLSDLQSLLCWLWWKLQKAQYEMFLWNPGVLLVQL